MSSSIMIKRMESATIPTKFGKFLLLLYNDNFTDKEHLVLVAGEIEDQENVLIRIHSSCFTGDVLGSLRCDCGPQLHDSMRMVSKLGKGIIIYLPQEGRGIGLLDKLRAYNLQDNGHDTVEANLLLGRKDDERDYTIAAMILADLRVKSVQIMTNNPKKIDSLRSLGVKITSRVEMEAHITPENIAYLTTKAKRMNHMFDLEALTDSQQVTSYYNNPI